jgi:hypothetical protein
MMRVNVGAAFDLRQGRIVQILQRSEARLGGTVQIASAGAAFMDLASGWRGCYTRRSLRQDATVGTPRRYVPCQV